MPFYDRTCQACGWMAVDRLEAVNARILPCPQCGAATERAWLTKPPYAIGDEIDITQTNGTKHPIRFRSRIERARWMKEQGLRQYDAYCPDQDGKDKHTVSWAAGGKDWLAKAEAQAKEHHNGGFIGNDPPEPDDLHVTWSSGTLTPEQVEHYRRQT